MNIDREKLYQGVLGLAIGDALGVPVEFVERYRLKVNPVTTMLGGGVWDVRPGTWSDDTAMTLATIDALNKANWEDNKLLYHIIMMNFEMWYRLSKFACFNHRFDIGNTCKEAIEHYSKFGNTDGCGRGEGKCGNGALMRILPAAFLQDSVALNISRLTHNNEECNTSTLIYVNLIRELINGKDKETAMENLRETFSYTKTMPKFSRMFQKDFKDLEERYIQSSGYVIDTLEAAIWCFLSTDNYVDCVLKAVNLGDDADTVGAVAGGLAGIYYGVNNDNGIPSDWINRLNGLEKIFGICFNK